MDDTWSRIEDWLRENAPEVLDNLLPGVTRDAIRVTETALDVTLPDDMVASYLIHDGQDNYSPALMGEWQLLSIEEVAYQWDIMRGLLLANDEVAAGIDRGDAMGLVRPDWWNLRWVPVAYNGGGDLHCVDLDPASGGTMGQMTTFWHVDEERELLAPSFRDWLSGYADDLEQSKYTVRREGWITKIVRVDG